jgi:hypothetical protein
MATQSKPRSKVLSTSIVTKVAPVFDRSQTDARRVNYATSSTFFCNKPTSIGQKSDRDRKRHALLFASNCFKLHSVW